MIYKFSENAKNDYSDIEKSWAYILHDKLTGLNGNVSKLTDDERNKLYAIFSELWHPETYKTGICRVMGYCIDFSEWLKVYWIKTKDYGIVEVKSFNKTFIRENAVTPSHILKIIEI